MKKILSLIFFAVFVTSYGYSQSAAIKKIATKFSSKTIKKEAFHSAAKRSEKELLKEGIERTGKKYTGQALGEQIVKKSIRNSILEKMEKEGIASFFGYSTFVSDNTIKRIGKSKLNVFNEAKRSRLSNYSNAVRNNASESVAKKELKRDAAHLIALYCTKEGYEKFMRLSMKERMVAIQKMTKHIYSLPEAERKKILADLTPENKEKILQTKKLMSSRFPSSQKGSFKGKKGDSDFVLNDSYVWKDKKTGQTMTVGELRKKYNIKEPIVIPYRNGEPDFSKYAFGKVKVNYTDDIDYKDLKGLHDQANVKLSNEQWIKQRQHNDAANPARDLIENMTVDGQYKKGCRNTYHETWDGETILIVPDFINDVCTHNGGRALAQIVK